ncbi:MAG: ATP synthase F1 subunit gamma, partial [Flavobacteriales bacterium CG03_land_8_20_14_0_80_35_15]
MANLKEIRNRIASIGSTMQITSAMKMVSAAKLKKAQDAIIQMRPYANKLTELLQNLSSNTDTVESPYLIKREVKNVLIVAITSNRGLCGGFNSNVIKETIRISKTDYADKNVMLFTVGKKGNDFLKKQFKVLSNHNEVYDHLTFANVSLISESLMNLYASAQFDKIIIVYNQFKNAATQLLQAEQFLPIVPKATQGNTAVNYIFEPNQADIVAELIPKSLKIQLYKAIRDSFASEHGARMTAMHKATDNATELRDALKLSYNKARQASITNEILEIVGG